MGSWGRSVDGGAGVGRKKRILEVGTGQRKWKMFNNHIRTENDFVAIIHDSSIDSLFCLSEIFLPAVHQPTFQSCMQDCVSCLHIQSVSVCV